MNVPTMTMPKTQAIEAYREYREAVRLNPESRRDQITMMGYRAMARGKAILNIHEALKAGGLDDRHRPKLALGCANWRFCWFRFDYYGPRFQSGQSLYGRWASRRKIVLPQNVIGWPWPRRRDGQHGIGDVQARAITPTIPPRLRPAGDLRHYHILWEAAWEQVPTDPILLRHLDGPLYVVLGMWDLTPLERSEAMTKAGRELDAEVALALGWKLAKYTWGPAQTAYMRGEGPFAPCYQPCEPAEATHFNEPEIPYYRIIKDLPHWSTSDADAVTLLAEATRRGWGYNVDGHEELSVCIDFDPNNGAAGCSAARCSTFAEAVSRAFIAAAKEGK